MSDAEIHALVIVYLFPALVVFTGVVAYVFGIRPALKQNPAFSKLYETEATALNAVNAKLSGIKQRLTTVVLTAGGVLMVGYDQLVPLMQQVGIDPMQSFPKYLPSVPSWFWPVASIAFLWLLQYFRNRADKQARSNAEALLNAGHMLAAPAPGISVNTLPSPPPFPDKVG